MPGKAEDWEWSSVPAVTVPVRTGVGNRVTTLLLASSACRRRLNSEETVQLDVMMPRIKTESEKKPRHG